MDAHILWSRPFGRQPLSPNWPAVPATHRADPHPDPCRSALRRAHFRAPPASMRAPARSASTSACWSRAGRIVILPRAVRNLGTPGVFLALISHLRSPSLRSAREQHLAVTDNQEALRAAGVVPGNADGQARVAGTQILQGPGHRRRSGKTRQPHHARASGISARPAWANAPFQHGLGSQPLNTGPARAISVARTRAKAGGAALRSMLTE
jgi:hypothetical protein